MFIIIGGSAFHNNFGISTVPLTGMELYSDVLCRSYMENKEGRHSVKALNF